MFMTNPRKLLMGYQLKLKDYKSRSAGIDLDVN